MQISWHGPCDIDIDVFSFLFVKEKCKWKMGGGVAQWTKIPKDLKITKHPHSRGVRLHLISISFRRIFKVPSKYLL
jgi:hypothetical protein